MTDEANHYPNMVPVGVDPTRASIARVYDAALGGKDHYAIDREVLNQIHAVAPQANDLAWANRNFLIRACRFLSARAGVDQFLDLGSGLPTAENTHQVVQRGNPDARVVYVDNDPVVLAHGRVLLEKNDGTRIIAEDIFRPSQVLEHPVVRDFLDFDRPLGLLQVGTLHHYLRDDVGDVMGAYVEALPPGSYVAVAHFFDPQTDPHTELARAMEETLLNSPMGSGRFRTRDQLMPIFAGLDLVEPGLVPCDEWLPDSPRQEELNLVCQCIVGAVGRKPSLSGGRV